MKPGQARAGPEQVIAHTTIRAVNVALVPELANASPSLSHFVVAIGLVDARHRVITAGTVPHRTVGAEVLGLLRLVCAEADGPARLAHARMQRVRLPHIHGGVWARRSVVVLSEVLGGRRDAIIVGEWRERERQRVITQH